MYKIVHITDITHVQVAENEVWSSIHFFANFVFPLLLSSRRTGREQNRSLRDKTSTCSRRLNSQSALSFKCGLTQGRGSMCRRSRETPPLRSAGVSGRTRENSEQRLSECLLNSSYPSRHRLSACKESRGGSVHVLHWNIEVIEIVCNYDCSCIRNRVRYRACPLSNAQSNFSDEKRPRESIPVAKGKNNTFWKINETSSLNENSRQTESVFAFARVNQAWTGSGFKKFVSTAC